MTPPLAPALGRVPDRATLARLLAALATGALVAVPVAMAVANRSAPLVLVVAALLAASSLVVASGWAALRVSLLHPLRTPEAGVAGLMLAWALVSIGWSVDRAASIQAFGEVLIPLAAAITLAATLPSRAPPWATTALAAAIAVTALAIVVELKLGFPLRRLFSSRIVGFAMNRPSVTLLLLAWPLLALLRREGRLRLAAGIAIAVGAGLVVSESGSAHLGLLTGGAALLLARLAPRPLLLGLGAALLTGLALAPVVGELADRAVPNAAHRLLASTHSRERVDVWLSFGEAARRRVARGIGFGAVPAAARDPVAARVPAARRAYLATGHPHNALLQVWVELGLPGVLLAGALIVLLVRRLDQIPDSRLAEPLAYLASAAPIAFESHGAWQAWWIAVVGAGIVLFHVAAPSPSLPREQPA